MMHVDVVRHQYGVGQGCFHLQTLECTGEPGADFTYRFVYDCGGSQFQSPKTLDWCITHATAGAQRLQIDAVYISHFEDDHVNGIEELCKNAAVSRIYAPHINLHSAVHIIAQQMAAGTNWTAGYQQFASTLFAIANGGDAFGVPVTRIRGGERPPEGPGVPNDRARELGDADQSVDAVIPAGKSVSHAVRIPLVLSARTAKGVKSRVAWEMVHWYYGADDQLTLQILAEIALIGGYAADCQPGLQANASDNEIETALIWMKSNRAQIAKAYKAAMAAHNAARATLNPPEPAFPDNHNVASLCLYSGPIDSRAYIWNSSADAFPCLLKRRDIYWFWAKRGAWIATGDAMLGLADVWDEFIAHFGTNRVDVCSTVLIPHHGADAATSHNFTDQLIRENQCCVISAGAINGYGHPHRNVVQAILKKPATLQLVTEAAPMGFVEYLAFQMKP